MVGFSFSTWQPNTHQGIYEYDIMASEAEIGELLVGAYHRIITDCEIVSYSQRSKEQGTQNEIDVVGIQSENGRQTVYGCEVLTHLHGTPYTGTPSTDRWDSFGGEKYQYTLERFWDKFIFADSYVSRVFDDADEYAFQLWAPVVPEGYLTEGLSQLSNEFEEETGNELEILVNSDYTERIKTLQERASEDKKDYGETAFRLLQILGHMR